MLNAKVKTQPTDAQPYWAKVVILVLGALLLTLISFNAGSSYNNPDNWNKTFSQRFMGLFVSPVITANQQTTAFDDKLFWEVYNTLKLNYVDRDKLQDKDMFYGAIAGLADSLKDPYTVFMSPQVTTEFKTDMSGKFEGIGAEITSKDGVVTVVSPIDDMPAMKAGIKTGDQIIKINGESALGLTANEAVKKIRGPKDTFVTLTISRAGRTEAFDLKIKRGIIQIKSVKGSLGANGIYTIRVSSFNDDTNLLFAEVVKDLQTKKAKKIILDLRNNPGGYLSSAINMGSYWINAGPIVSEKYGDGTIKSHSSNGNSLLKDIPTVVLINGGSASASEIVAGALKDKKQATLVGEKSYGKGSVQMVKEFEDGSSLKVTAAKWLTPNGGSIDHQGIEPDVKVASPKTEAEAKKEADAKIDRQMNKAIEILKKMK